MCPKMMQPTMAETIRQSGEASGLVTVDGRTFPLRSAALRSRAEGGIAETELTQRYENPYDEALEVLYTMPLPADAAVVGYTITLGERVITGRVETVENAKQEYREALEQGRTAGLLEQHRPDTFMQKLGNIPAGEAATVEIRVLQPLAFLTGEERGPSWEYRFPSVVGVRYHGEPGRVTDAEQLDAPRADGAGTPATLELDLTLADGDPAALAAGSPSHLLATAGAEAGAHVSLAETPRLDRDLVVQWRAAQPDVGMRLVEGRGLDGDDGRYGLLTITPPAAPQRTWARDLTILLDASGSMSGWPLECSKQLVLSLLDSLNANDRFEVLAFSNRVEHLTPTLCAGGANNVRRAKQAVEALSAGGGTEMAGALRDALKPLGPESQRQVILMTDGYIGFENEVVRNVLDGLQDRCRVHAVGVGSAPNRSLTRGVARAGRGVELFVENGETPQLAADRLLAATVDPVLTELGVSGTAVREVAPQRPRDVLAGQPIVLTVELDPNGGTVKASGMMPDGLWRRSLQVDKLTPQTTATPIPLGALFGREAVEEQETLAAAGEDVDARIEALGLRHRIATRRTSLVAVADEPSVDPKQPRRRRKLEVELPVGVSAHDVGLMPTGICLDQRSLCAPTLIGSMPERFDASQTIDARRVGVRGMGASGMLVLDARLVRSEGRRWVLEFETPHDDFELPGVDVKLMVTGAGKPLVARLDEKASSASGPHVAGLTVRMVLLRKRLVGWPRGPATVTWVAGGKQYRLAVSSDL
ncbi:MAG: VWA domain-containing protein [bacterium]|nr:VWA domain-containing protein [bacterium]